MDTDTKLTRRALLETDAAILAAIVFWPMLAHHQVAKAGTASKDDFYYQDHPKDGKNCAGCAAFSPDGPATGSCRIIAGTVTANGWCMAWSKRQ